MENKHEKCLMISEETMRCRKIRRILRYHVPHKFSSPEKFAHHVPLLFYPFGFLLMYQNKLQEEGFFAI